LRSSRVRNAGQRITHRNGQNSASLGECGKVRVNKIFLDLPETFIIAEEKCLVFDDRTAEGKAELIAVEWRFDSAERFEKSDGV
jgi:hypothetical protein